jgi:F0F1-type ATP synthase assembly protein I
VRETHRKQSIKLADNKPNKPPTESGPSAANMAMSIGFAIVIPLILCILGGVALDKWLNTTPIFILVGVFLGLFICGYQLWQLAKASQSD